MRRLYGKLLPTAEQAFYSLFFFFSNISHECNGEQLIHMYSVCERRLSIRRKVNSYSDIERLHAAGFVSFCTYWVIAPHSWERKFAASNVCAYVCRICAMPSSSRHISTQCVSVNQYTVDSNHFIILENCLWLGLQAITNSHAPIRTAYTRTHTYWAHATYRKSSDTFVYSYTHTMANAGRATLFVMWADVRMTSAIWVRLNVETERIRE